MAKSTAGGQVTQGGGDGGDQAAAVTGAAAAQTTDAAGSAKPWYDTYPDDIKKDLAGYDKPETLAKEHVELKRKYRVPEKIEEYEYDMTGLDDQQKASVNAFRKEAQALGLSTEQFKKVVGKGMEQNKAFIEQRKLDDAKKAQVREAEVRKGIDELKSEWGNKFDGNIERAKKTMRNIFPATFGQFLDTTGLGNHPEMVRAMVRLSDSISEDVLVRNNSKQKPGNRDPQTGEPMLKFSSMK